MHPKTIDNVGVNSMKRISLKLLNFLLLYLLRHKISGYIIAEEEVPKGIHERHTDTFTTASDGQINKQWIKAIDFSHDISIFSFSLILLTILSNNSPQEPNSNQIKANKHHLPDPFSMRIIPTHHI